MTERSLDGMLAKVYTASREMSVTGETSVKVLNIKTSISNRTHRCTYVGCNFVCIRDLEETSHKKLMDHARDAHKVVLTHSCTKNCPYTK